MAQSNVIVRLSLKDADAVQQLVEWRENAPYG